MKKYIQSWVRPEPLMCSKVQPLPREAIHEFEKSRSLIASNPILNEILNKRFTRYTIKRDWPEDGSNLDPDGYADGAGGNKDENPYSPYFTETSDGWLGNPVLPFGSVIYERKNL